MSKHSTGPWKWEEGQPKVFATWNGKDYVVASVEESRLGWHEDRLCESRERGANARLIAASPELLTSGKHLAVKLAEVYRAAGQNPADCQAIRDWMAAIAKAEGRS